MAVFMVRLDESFKEELDSIGTKEARSRAAVVAQLVDYGLKAYKHTNGGLYEMMRWEPKSNADLPSTETSGATDG